MVKGRVNDGKAVAKRRLPQTVEERWQQAGHADTGNEGGSVIRNKMGFHNRRLDAPVMTRIHSHVNQVKKSVGNLQSMDNCSGIVAERPRRMLVRNRANEPIHLGPHAQILKIFRRGEKTWIRLHQQAAFFLSSVSLSRRSSDGMDIPPVLPSLLKSALQLLALHQVDHVLSSQTAA